MELFAENSWDEKKNAGKQNKKMSQKRKKKDGKKILDILKSKTNNQAKKKKKKKLDKVEFTVSSKIQEGELPNVQKKKKAKKKSLQSNLPSPNFQKFKVKGHVFKKLLANQEKFGKNQKLKMKKLKKDKNSYLVKQKLIQDQKTNSQSSVVSKSKKRKLSEIGDELEQVTKTKKQKMSKRENNASQDSQKFGSQNSEKKMQMSKSMKRRIRRKKRKEAQVVEEQQNVNSDQIKKKSNLKININKIEEMLKQKKKNKHQPESKPPSLREKMLSQLRSSRFRFLNESLYSSASTESKEYFKNDPDAFIAYHEGYKQQVAQWPLNPLDVIIASIKKLPKDYIVADFGCGDAKLADSVPQTVHSFDLVAMNDKIKACDMAHTPLLTNGVNVVVFCLSLMGTNLSDYLLEANRVLKKGGVLKIAEVESRFDNIENFINLLTSYGFANTWSDLSNDLFYFLDFKKKKDVNRKKKNLPSIELKPCFYKKR